MNVTSQRSSSQARAAPISIYKPSRQPYSRIRVIALVTAIADADLILTAARAPRGDSNLAPAIPITLDYGGEFTWDGGAQGEAAIAHSYSPVCHPDAVQALCDAWQVTIIDPEWGRNDVLWPALERFAAARPDN